MMPEIPSEKQATLTLDCPACGRVHTVYACVTGEHVLMCPCGSWIYVEVRDGDRKSTRLNSSHRL